MPGHARFFVFLTLLVQVIACSSDREDSQPDGASPLGAGAAADRPWEITNDQGESILPNIFYAEASENEQVMPLTIRGKYQIDRLIYPTLGNPNLYVKDDPKDSFMTVLRIEESAFAHLAPAMSSGPSPHLQVLRLREDQDNALSFYLVARSGRGAQTERADTVPAGAPGTYAIHPTALLIHDVPSDMPEAFKRRRTVRVVFDRAALAEVPEGLYDVRFEAKKGGKIEDLSGDTGKVYEYQYNALRVFDHAPVDSEYTALNVTDTQISVGDLYGQLARPMLQDFVHEVNTSQDPAVAKASFITFNGDLHNGGSVGGVRQRFVAVNYNEEAKFILDTLKELRLPIFLVAGNHDGNASTGIVPSWVSTFDHLTFESLEEVVRESKPSAWPNFRWDDYQRYRSAVEKHPSGYARDIFTGSHVRREGDTFAESWRELPRDQRNMVLYDGFHQWQRTYGPLYSSFSFGKNRYVNLNSFDLRQHRRSGWGMYVVNYGGGMSPVQMGWVDRELSRGKDAGQDVVLLAHHDPRGGHKGTDFGYYFAQLDYSGMGQSAYQYLVGSALSPFICKAPDWVLPDSQEEDCLHDGLSEWMRPEEAFDKTFTGYELVDKIAKNVNVRTLILGHTHYNSLEVLRPGDALVPDRAGIERMHSERGQSLAAREVDNPVRGHAWLSGDPGGEYDPGKLPEDTVVRGNDRFFGQLAAAADSYQTSLQGTQRELAVVRLTSNAKMTKQKYEGDASYGFSVLSISRKNDSRGYALPQVNAVTFRVNHGGQFEKVGTVDLDRTHSLKVADANNPVTHLFDGGPAIKP